MRWMGSVGGLLVGSLVNIESGTGYRADDGVWLVPDKAGIQFRVLNRSKGPAVWVCEPSLVSVDIRSSYRYIAYTY